MQYMIYRLLNQVKEPRPLSMTSDPFQTFNENFAVKK